MKSHRFTPVHLTSPKDIIRSTDKIFCLGSCFADNIGSRLSVAKMDAKTNPLGILYNPASVGNMLEILSESIKITEAEVRQRGEIYFHYNLHSDMNSLSSNGYVKNVNKKLSSAASHLHDSKWIIITLGTSIVHELKENGQVVANCHKMDQALFEKRMLSVKQSLSSLKDSLPDDKQIILTVSPIRHTREGAAQNQRSKSRLIEVANLLADQSENVHYFPAYEIMMDELRDYRYYEADMIHPSKEAVDIIWAKFVEHYFDSSTKEKIQHMQKLSQSLAHRPMHIESSGYKEYCEGVLAKITDLSERYPNIDFSTEKAEMENRIG